MARGAGYGLAALSWLLRGERALGGPVAAAVEPTDICSLRCPLCATGAGLLDRERGCMSLQSFTAVLDALPGSVRDLYLWGQGEPFLAPDFTAMIRAAAGRGLRTIVSTNGHHFDDPDAVASSGLSRLIVSLDGIDRESYARYRRGGDFDRVTAGIREVAAAVRRHGRKKKPVIELQYLLTADSVADMGRFRALAAGLGADLVSFKTLQAASMPGGDALLPADLRYTRYRRDREGRLVPDRLPLSGRCLRIYFSCQIDWQGNVLPCCFDKNSRHIMGNVFEQPLADIWNGPAFRAFRRAFTSGGRPWPMCADCTEGLRRRTIHG